MFSKTAFPSSAAVAQLAVNELVLGSNPSSGAYISRNTLKINNHHMAKRATGVGKRKKTHSHKTAKRLEVKRQMLEKLAAKRKKK